MRGELDDDLPGELLEVVLALTQDWFVGSNGSLNTGLGRLHQLWQESERTGHPPERAAWLRSVQTQRNQECCVDSIQLHSVEAPGELAQPRLWINDSELLNQDAGLHAVNLDLRPKAGLAPTR